MANTAPAGGGAGSAIDGTRGRRHKNASLPLRKAARRKEKMGRIHHRQRLAESRSMGFKSTWQIKEVLRLPGGSRVAPP
jgi:hypothetical protein